MRAAWHTSPRETCRRPGPERKAIGAIVDKLPEDAPYGLNHAKPVLLVGEAVLDGKIAAASGDKAAAADVYRKAIALQDQLNYDEPQDWYYPVRETLGAALFIDGDITGAEAVFRSDLERNPGNGRSLYGLSKALEAPKNHGIRLGAIAVQGRLGQGRRAN